MSPNTPDKKNSLAEKIKEIVFQVVYNNEDALSHNLSIHLTTRLDHDYTYMSNVFSETQHVTIEKFYISLKIERVKELIEYENMSLTEAASKMRYSSVSHLSNQFKRVAGITASDFKKQCDQKKM